MRRLLAPPSQNIGTQNQGQPGGFTQTQGQTNQPHPNQWSVVKEKPKGVPGTGGALGGGQGGGFLTSLAKGIAEPFVKAGVTGVSALESTGRLAIGDQKGAEKALQGYDVPGFGHVAPAKIGTDVEEQMKTGEGAFGKETLKTIGTGAQIAATFAPGGEAATIGEKGVLEAGEQVAKKTLGQVIKKGATEAAAVGAVGGFGSSAQKEGVSTSEVVKGALEGGLTGGVFGAGLPLAQAGIGKLSNIIGGNSNLGARVVNSIIKPLKKDFSYGANPGRTVAAEGITGNTLEELAGNISKRRQEIGRQISETAAKSEKIIDISESLAPLDKALEEAKKNPRTNASLIRRLEDTRDDILGKPLKTETVTPVSLQKDIDGKISALYPPNIRTLESKSPYNLSNTTISDAVDFKRRIGDMTKWTGNKSDDEEVNKALKQIYGKIKGKVNEAVPELKAMNEKYADLTSAETAAKYRDVIEQRQNIIKFAQKHTALLGGLIGAFSTGGLGTVAGASAGFALEKALESPAIMTRVAAFLSRSTSEEREIVLQAYPMLRNIVLRSTEQDQSKETLPVASSRGRILNKPPIPQQDSE